MPGPTPTQKQPNDQEYVFSKFESCCWEGLVHGQTAIVKLFCEKKLLSARGSVEMMSIYIKSHRDVNAPAFKALVSYAANDNNFFLFLQFNEKTRSVELD